MLTAADGQEAAIELLVCWRRLNIDLCRLNFDQGLLLAA
jgi:hypothetical protein